MNDSGLLTFLPFCFWTPGRRKKQGGFEPPLETWSLKELSRGAENLAFIPALASLLTAAPRVMGILVTFIPGMLAGISSLRRAVSQSGRRK